MQETDIDEQAIADVLTDVDRDEDVVTVSFDVDESTFLDLVIPYSIGLMSVTHGLTGINYEYRELEFTKVVSEVQDE